MVKSRIRGSGLFMSTVLVLGLLGCSSEDTTQGSTSSVLNNTFDHKAVIQGAIFDATTGARLGGSGLTVTLVQGTSHRRPNLLITDTAQALVGEYAFADVPISLNAGDNTFKLVVTNTGYQQFEGLVALTAAPATANNTLDANFNFVRDIYVFPTGSTAPNVDIVVEVDQEPVVGATVLLQQNPNNNTALTPVPGAPTRLAAAPGMLASLSAITALDANGVAKATFSGSNLVLGGAYTPVVLPVRHEGVQRTLATGTPFILGANAVVHTQVIALADAVPGTQNDGIHVVFTSNRDTEDITGLTNPGRLTLVFNRAVELVGTTATPFTATLQNAGAAVLTSPGANGSVTSSLSADGLTLTLTPVFSTAPVATDVNLQVTYAGGLVKVKDDEGDLGVSLFGNLTFLDGVAISGVVNILGP